MPYYAFTDLKISKAKPWGIWKKSLRNEMQGQ